MKRPTIQGLLMSIMLLCSGALTAQDCLITSFTMYTSAWGAEVSWELQDSNGDLVATNLVEYENDQVYTDLFCLDEGCYTLVMMDSFGDGWNGGALSISNELYAGTFEMSQGEYEEILIGFGQNSDSCETNVLGCTDPQAWNYNPNATLDDGSCLYQDSLIYGCTDPNALNFNPEANFDNGTCIYEQACDSGYTAADMYVCVFSEGANVALNIYDEDGTVIYSQQGYADLEIQYNDLCLLPGVCYSALLQNLSGPEGWYGGYMWVNANGVEIANATLQDGQSIMVYQFSLDGTCGTVLGCTDAEAVNYNPNANQDDGTCIYATANDLCADAQELVSGETIVVDNTGAIQNEGVWGDCWSFGQGEGEQTSVWYSFTTPAEPAHITMEAIGDGTYTLTDTQFGLFESCGGDMIYCDGNSGEGLLSAFDFPCGTLSPSTTYYLIVDGYYGDSGTCLLSYEADTDCSDEPDVLGCTDPEAINYNPLANVDDGSCVYLPDSCDGYWVELLFTTGAWGNEVSFTISDDMGNAILAVDGFESNTTYAYGLCLEAGCYTIEMSDTFGDGWNGAELSVMVDGQFIGAYTLEGGEYDLVGFGVLTSDCEGNWGAILGCTDVSALNYDPTATIDDGSCVYDSIPNNCWAYFELIDIDQENDIVYLANLSEWDSDFPEFLWNFGDGNYSPEMFPTHQYAEEGTYMVCLELWDGDCWSSYCDTITYISGGFTGNDNGEAGVSGSNGWWLNVNDGTVSSVAEWADADWSLFPVPASESLQINLGLLASEDLMMTVYDLSGREVLPSENLNLGAQQGVVTLDLSSLSEGSYIIRLRGTTGQTTKRFQIMR